MGCGSSTATGRDSTNSKIPREAEAFFPPPETLQQHKPSPPKSEESTQRKPSSSKATPTSAPVSSAKKKEAYVPPSSHLDPPLAVPPASSSPKQQAKRQPAKQSQSATNSSPDNSPGKKKKKSTYVPPAPIAVSFPPPFSSTGTSNISPPTSSAADIVKNTASSSTEKTPVQPAPKRENSYSDDEGSLDSSDALLHPPDNPDVLGSLGDLLGNSVLYQMVGGEQQTEPQQKDLAGPVAMEDPAGVQYDSDTTPQPSSESGMRFDELYRLKGVLGTGAFSTVREGFHRSNTHTSFAVKCINRKKLSEEDEAALLDEVAILKELNHVHIIRLYDFFEEPSTYYLVMERMRGGELFDRIVAKAYYNEKEARDTCKIVLAAVGYCHQNHVAHRDLKPENLLLRSENDDSAVKIADFGFAKKVYEQNSLTTQCGTPGYVAPEILEGTPYDERADMWSVGVILYILLGGYPPFIESTQRDLFRKIRKGEYEFHEEYWGTVSAEAKDLISSLLCVDASARLTADQALANQWITGDDAKLAKRDLGPNLQKFRNFNAKRKFRAAVSTIIAVNKLNSLTEEFFTTLKETSVQEVVQQELLHSTHSKTKATK